MVYGREKKFDLLSMYVIVISNITLHLNISLLQCIKMSDNIMIFYASSILS